MTNISDAIQFPTTSDDWGGTVLIGGILTFLVFLLIPLFIVYGYLLELIRTNYETSTQPGSFENWGALLIDGLKAWIIGLIYLFVPIVVAAVTIGWSGLLFMTGTRAGAIGGVGSLFAGLALSAILFLLFGYFAVAGIVNYAIEQRFGAAFEFSTMKTVGLNSNYAIAWLLSIVVFFVASLVNVIPFIGWIFAPFAWFYAAMVSAKLWTDGFSKAVA